MQGRIIAVTGAAGVLGRAVIAELSEAGAFPVAIDISDTSNVDGARLMLSGLDLLVPGVAEHAVKWIRSDLGGLDGLVNVAGGFRWETLREGDPATWERMFRVNVSTAVTMSWAAVPSLVERKGAIVNVGAAAAARAGPGMGAYAASKAGVSRLTEALSEELKAEGVRVNAVLPSILDTVSNRAELGEQDSHKWVKPKELARVIAFLLSDAASAVTGASLPVTGRV